MAVSFNITNNLARIIGLVASKHTDCSIAILWREGTPEEEWIVTATDGVEDHVYVANDESGIWAPLNDSELSALSRGASIFAVMDEAMVADGLVGSGENIASGKSPVNEWIMPSSQSDPPLSESATTREP